MRCAVVNVKYTHLRSGLAELATIGSLQ